VTTSCARRSGGQTPSGAWVKRSTLVHQDMVAEGVLEAIPLLLPLDAEDDDFEPEVIPGKPLSEIILEDRR